MTAEETASVDAFRVALVHASTCICIARDELCALDATSGDGDLGATLALGFEHAGAALREADASDAGALLALVGRTLATKAPSTIGALLASAFLRAGTELAGTGAIDAASVCVLLGSAAEGVADRGSASPGERTVLDAMVPAAEAATAAERVGAGLRETLREAVTAGAAGADATADMEPVHGRAGWIKERARGNRDAGAVAWAIFVHGLAAGLDSETNGLELAAPIVDGDPQ